MIITKTPFRMSFFGGGTDMESFFKEYGGAVISTTFDKYCYVNVRHLPCFFDYSTELTYSKSERVSNIDDIQHPAIRNAMKMLDMHEIRLTYEADLPARSGLGTSSSFAVGMLNAFYAFIKLFGIINKLFGNKRSVLVHTAYIGHNRKIGINIKFLYNVITGNLRREFIGIYTVYCHINIFFRRIVIINKILFNILTYRNYLLSPVRKVFKSV